MAISKNGLTIFALLVTLITLGTENIIEFSSPALPVHYDEEHFLPHTRQKRNVLTDEWNYILDVVVNASSAQTFEQIRFALNATSLPIQLDNNTEITDVVVTTVCSPTGSGFQCRCEEQFAWPYSSCVLYTACDSISSGICKCINAIPTNGQSCQPISELLSEVEYAVDVELNVTDVETINYLRSILSNGSYSLALGPIVNVTDIDITTVCYPNDTNFQCRCEDQHVWSYRNCITYGACDKITDNTCRCINGIPSDGQYCQPKEEAVQLYEYVIEVEIRISDIALIEQLRDNLENISFPVKVSNTINITQIDIIFTVPPVVYEYDIFIEVNTTDPDQLRNTLDIHPFPIQVSSQINISAADITTVCSKDGSEFQCRCEEDYLWPCDKCATHGKCDGDTNNSCACIKAIPTDGQYCQSIHQQNFSVCPLTTTSPSTAPPVLYEDIISVELNISDLAVINQLRSILSNISYPISISNQVQISDVNISTVCSPSSGSFQCRCEDQYRWPCDQCFLYGPCDNITGDTCGCINAIPPDGQYCQSAHQYNFTACPLTTTPSPTTPPILYEYLISIELNISDVAVIDQLRSILSNISYPISISNQLQISDINISTVCSPSSGGFQCRCEDQYRWPCDQCSLYGPCDNISGDTCGCINAIPPDGQYCQSAHQYNFTACPQTTPSPPSTTPLVLYEDIISVELNISDVAVINQLRSILSNISYPISISNQVQISEVNVSTVCSPSSGSFQCRCEDQYRWPCGQCFLYGPCDNITGDTCGCINAIPPDGQYCQSAHQYNFTACPLTTTPSPTTPLVFYEYLISIELNISDVAVINQLRSILSNISYPISISNQLQISDINISTVCSLSSGSFQCRCEDQYRWPCDQCSLYGPCDNISGDTCGCINAIPPDGQYCQSAHQYNFTACPQTTPSPPSTTPPVLYEDIISVELNISDVAVINQLRSILSNISYPISISNQVQISEVNVSTVCSPSSGSFQCRCEDQYRWPCDQCFLYGPCDNITGDTCGCINAIPPDGQYCQSAHQYNFTACPLTTTPSPTTPPVLYEYLISIELNISDVAVINQLRSILSNISYPIGISNQVQISDVNISTVCSPSSGSFQCRCEDQYRWPCDQCFLYGPCDNITGDTCGCINAIPPDGQYCQSAHQYNFTACPLTTTPSPTSPPVLYEYLISIELNISDVAVINQLRRILSNISYPIRISNQVQISDVNISTVCSPSSGGFQCRCEDQYRWPCDQCFLYGPCDNITGDTCGCINAIPPVGQYCQSAHQYNFTACPLTTTPSPTTPPVLYEYLISIELNISDVAVINQLRSILSNISYPIRISNQVQISDVNISTVCSLSSGGFQCRCEDQYRWPCDQCFLYGPCDNITGDTCGCINAIPPVGQYCQSAHQYNFTACPLTTTPSPTTPPVLYEYLISIELNSSDVAVINQLRSILSNISYPISISNQVQISDVNISTVCSPSSGSFQCRCEDQYRWPCDQCFLYGPCDNITVDTCGCINAIPPDGQYCKSAHQYNFTACPLTTTPSPTSPPVLYEYLISIELNISDVAVINQLRRILSNISYPIRISNQVQISDVNISTVCSPSSGGFQCRCEDQYRWPCDQCFLYGPCDNITGDTCGCINAIPPVGQYCQSAHQYNFTACPLTTTPSPTTPPVLYEYLISIELNISDVAVINQLRSILSNISYPIRISNQVQISDVNISTVCSLSSGGFQCRCEDQYRWPCDQCFLYGPCDNITGDTCGCINAIPPVGQYCQSAHQYNFTACPLTTTPSPTTPPVLYEYLISIELNISDVAVINQLRSILSNISYPIRISNQVQISDVNISTVCSLSSGGFQCRCEDQYRWPCDQCFLYGPCDNITGDTCGCINAIPPVGQYCQSAHQYNFTACPLTTTPSPTTPPVLYEYLIFIELNISDVVVINQLRSILSNISYPIGISNQVQISDVNISTVCSPSSGSFQCRCEDQYRWPCDQCFLYGPCDNIADDTCGCINAIPPDGQYCQSAHEYNFTACPQTPTSPPSTTPPPTTTSPPSTTPPPTTTSPPSTTPPPTTTSPPPTTPLVLYEYLISIELNISDVAVINQLRSILSNISYPISISNQLQIFDVNISTVCSPSSGSFQCICEDQYRWPCDQCSLYGPCDNITDDTCGCINAIPPDGQYCQSAHQYNFTACPQTPTSPPSTTPLVLYEYLISIELNISDVAVINKLRSILSNISYPISISNQLQISDVNISTVCSPSSGDFQCRCEDLYRWPCDQCFRYGPCDNITGDTCGCINAIPPDGQYCQSAHQYNFTACPQTTPSPPSTTPPPTTTSPPPTTPPPTTTSPPPTTPLVLYEYLISIELNISDVAVINQLRSILSNISYPISISNQLQISDVNISTVCSPSSGGFQCRCEDQYRWPCDQCFRYGPCDNINGDTCGCINAIPPDGQYCQSAHQYNFTACPQTPTSPPSTTSPPTTTSPPPTTPPPTTTSPPPTTPPPTTTSPPPTTPLVLYEYLISIELNISDVAVINQLRSILSNISYPISISNQLQISDVNISTVCSPSSGGFQCRCEDQYRWPCDQCFRYGPCDNINGDTCDCINAIPPDGQYCQSAHQYNFTACPLTTPSPTNSTPIATTPVNTTTPTIPPTNSTTPPPPPTTTTTPPPTTTPTPTPTANSTPIATTPVNTTTPTMPPTNSTTPPLTPPPPTTTTTTTTTPPTPPPTTTNNTTTTNNNNNNNNNNNTTTNNTTTTTTTPPPPTMVTSIPAPTTALTTTTKATTTTTITTTTTVVTGFDVQMSVTLDKEYTDALSNPESDTYKNLKSSIETVLEEQYKGMTGFLSVFVKAFRQGSVITDFVVQTTQVITDEFAKANQDLPEAMKPIAPVFGPVTAVYNSPTPISPPPDILYTGNTMRLTCDEPPESLAMGTISVSRWKFNGREIKNNRRIKITISGKKSLLTIQNVVLADIGNYECTLEGQVITFSQKGRVLEAKIKQAPNVQIQSKVNVKCQEVKEQPLDCCVQSPYTVKWYRGLTVLPTEQIPQPGSYCIRHKYKISCDELLTITFECKVDEPTGYMMTTAMTIFRDPIECDDNQYGAGRQGDTSTIGCGKGQEGSKTAVCEERKWKLTEDTCILTQIKDLVIVSQDLEKEQVPEFVGNLSRTVLEEKTEVSESSATISAIVGILNTIANVSTTVDKPVMEDVLQTVDVIIGDDARESWATLNSNGTRNASSELLGSLETLSNGLVGEFVIETERILLNRTRFNNSFMANLNSSIILDIPDTDITNTSITTITFSTLNNVMPVRNTSFNMSLFNANSSETVSDNTINAAVVLIRINATIQNVTLTYNKRNKSLSLNPQCVFWNFTLFDNLGAWDDEGCEFVSDVNNTVTCNCNHLTSFSILMATDIPPELKDVLDIITYVGVGISLASLVICLIIEGYVWKAITRNSTAFMRHVSIINTALSLLIADICFIIAASVAKNSLENPGEDYNVPVGPCSTATFFMHFFYLALFFWMLVSGLLLFYRTVMVFSHMSKSTMLAIGFSLGYGGPLIIAVITVAVTAPGKGYIRKDYACWLNWMETKALLAMVIPALIIVFINILIVIVVLFKMLRRGVGDAAQTDEKHTLWVIVRCVVILTPLFGLTWSLGVGTMVSSTNKGLHIAFAFFNSLQGFFILVFGTLFDSKIRALLSKKLPGPTSSTGSNPTRSTSGGVSSLSGLNLISRLRGRRYIYRVSEATNSSSNGASESFMNI
ncbi:uncharacterized protein LOC127367939 isoform X50 [Dicentrarchus labrax]|uniref:uncharacterized protein LOC127367939 isoform X50 n=1 Tax=Dicentrarchus labrax TaxID=13489 RepID=UPI0021F599A8|nr:uncharacterized protein LOC127367939 isoform X50 [Dicentrarchus labrax]